MELFYKLNLAVSSTGREEKKSPIHSISLYIYINKQTDTDPVAFILNFQLWIGLQQHKTQ